MDLELRTRIWNNLVTSKFKCFYIERLIERNQIYNKVIVGFLTVTTLGSVSAWAIWDKFPMVWAAIIASSQVVSALRPVFSFEKRIKYLIEIRSILCDIELEFEQLYSDFNSFNKNDEEAVKCFFLLKKRLIEATKPTEKNIIKDRLSLKKKAQSDTNTYFIRNYNLNT